MSKRGGAAKRGGRFLSVEEEDRLRTNVLRRNSLNNQLSRNSDREEGSEMDATDILVQVVGNLAENDSALERVRRLEGDREGPISHWTIQWTWRQGGTSLILVGA